MAAMPAAKFVSKAQVIDTESALSAALDVLERSRLIGFDTETRPSFRRGVSHRVSLMQLSSEDGCYLIRLHKLGISDRLAALLENPAITKVGLSLKDDFHQLAALRALKPAGFTDLQSFVKKFGIKDNSLSKIHAILFGERISKNQRLSNWEAEELSQAQINYAGYDAVACMRIYQYLQTGEFDPRQSPYKIEKI